MKYVIDIDGTICNNTWGEYEKAKPKEDRIEKINGLYDTNYIIYFTARGSSSGLDWYNFTKKQLKKWKCKYHKLIIGKPEGDMFIDDKGIHPTTFFCDGDINENCG